MFINVLYKFVDSTSLIIKCVLIISYSFLYQKSHSFYTMSFSILKLNVMIFYLCSWLNTFHSLLKLIKFIFFKNGSYWFLKNQIEFQTKETFENIITIINMIFIKVIHEVYNISIFCALLIRDGISAVDILLFCILKF